MSSAKGVVQLAASKVDRLVKPEPPDDLWEQMDKIAEECGIRFHRPKKSFTCMEYAKKYGLTKNQANKRLTKLRKANRIELVHVGTYSYYVLVKP